MWQTEEDPKDLALVFLLDACHVGSFCLDSTKSQAPQSFCELFV